MSNTNKLEKELETDITEYLNMLLKVDLSGTNILDLVHLEKSLSLLVRKYVEELK